MIKEKDIKEMRKIIKKNNAAKFGLDEDYEIYNSLLVEDYLANQYKDDKSDADCKKMIFRFSSKYMHKDLYIAEAVKDNIFYVLIEDEGDEIIDRLLIGEFKRNETLDDFEILDLRMRVEDHLRLVVILDGDNVTDEDRLEEFKTIGKYLGMDYYICNAIDIDKYESTIRLITDKEGVVIKKINY